MHDATVLYYTANTEQEAFERKIRDVLMGRLNDEFPIVSVSHKPIDLGMNICVGVHEAYYGNEYRQILIGAKAAKTTWLIAAEADCLYPPAYFTFNPNGGNLWRYNNVWILWKDAKRYGSEFRRKGNSEGAQIARREWLIEKLERAMAGEPEWYEGSLQKWGVKIYGRREWGLYGSEAEPVISMKTGDGVRPKTRLQGRVEPTIELPLWGSAERLRKELFE